MSLLPTLLQRGKVFDKDGNALNPYQKSIEYLIDKITAPKELNTFGDRVWILQSATGSGKSTILPPFLRRRFKGNHRMIVCTQPRIYNTITIPESIAKYNPDFIIGETLGYSTSKKKVIIKGEGIMFVTVDTILAQLQALKERDFLKKYSHILLDECHMRSLGMDLALYKLKLLLMKHFKDPMCPTIICMSATFDVDHFAKYWETSNIMVVLGATFPVENHFLERPVQNTEADMAKKAIDLIKANPNDGVNKDILLFITGSGMANKVEEKLLKLKESEPNLEPFEIIKALSNTMDEARPRIEIKSDMRRVLLGSNAVETGVTFNYLKYVIEPGWELASEYNPVNNTDSLLSKPVDQGAATQRRGRAGRVAPGECHFMYTEETYKAMAVSKLPDSLTSEISEALLYILIDRFEFSSLKTLDEIIDKRDELVRDQVTLVKRGIKSNQMVGLDMLDPPTTESVARGMSILHQLGAIDKDNMPTVMGLIIYRFNKLGMMHRKTLLSGTIFNVSFRDLNMAMWLIRDANSLRKDGDLLNPYMKGELFEDLGWGRKWYPFIMDKAVNLLLLFYVFKNKLKRGIRYCKVWCESIGLDYQNMVVSISLAYEAIKSCKTFRYNYDLNKAYSLKNAILDYNKTGDYTRYLDFIKRWKLCIYQGFKSNVLLYNGKHYTMLNGKQVIVKPSPDNNPPCIIYYSGLLKENPATGVIKTEVRDYSVMSGYLGVDQHFY